ncbi:hypothetical protein Moror_11984 [Moniliophthora roreri MCA 2997]|uniref:Uncharacterized protein n=1 Tax=Moniliophthora roreri (strain MCA 2997) TaxID=1381753 RepID=V2Y5U2_MONRO|nr:hypothetical protein Moror_11984 [Moniliophthora roreri MCA 2997]
MDTHSSLPLLHLGDTFGAFLIAVIMSSCLYGVTCLQTWYYFRTYNDRLLLRIMFSLFCNNPLALKTASWSAAFTVPLSTAINTIMHLFYAARMYNVGDRRDRRIPPIVCILKVLQIVVGNLYSNLFMSTLNLRKIHAKALLPVSVEPSHLSFAMTGNLSSGIGSTHPVEVRFPEPPIQSSQSWSAKCE